ncbi:stage II sporulation protein M [Cohnella candidum]|uniref:Stage II sporulation protein M n=1 Tax=Cohnella candidum TaxID=2674991 RepID=A0A3G3K578_9BACL|nr:stage II sporulation protein M [Cohnella candidum]AYQ75580.1 stage II sporulation protein M [Cohnella candidum]
MNVRLWSLSARENVNLYLFVGVLLVVGAVFGALLVHALTFAQQQELAEHLGLYMKSVHDAQTPNPAGTFSGSFLFYAKWLVLIWLLGISVIGLPLVLVLDFLKGVLIGFTVGLLIHEYAWQGVLVSLAAVAPQNALVVPALMIASVSAARFAYFVVRERLFRRKGRLLPPFLAHTASAALMLAMLCLASLYEAYVSPLLLERVAPHAAMAETSISTLLF